MADNVEIAEDPDQVWGVAARELLGPLKIGLVGLMLACLLAALMSSADCCMLIVSALIVRNGYAAYINPKAIEKTYVLAGRLVGIAVIAGGVTFSLIWYNVFQQVKIVWELPIIFAAPFWVGMYWRRATPAAAWVTVAFTVLAFFAVPVALPMVVPSLAESRQYAATNEIVTTITTRKVAPVDVARRKAEIAAWHEKTSKWIEKKGPQSDAVLEAKFGPCPQPFEPGQMMKEKHTAGGKAIYWKGGVEPVDEDGNVKLSNDEGKVLAIVKQGEIIPVDDHQEYVYEEISRTTKDDKVIIYRRYRPDCPLRGIGSFQLDFLVYDVLDMPLEEMKNAELETLRLPTRVVLPFVVMILLSLITRRSDKEALDRYYVKMKTPVNPDREADRREMELSYENPARFDGRRLFPFGGLEFQKPRWIDIAGFVVSLAVCFLIIWLIIYLAGVGG